ncbi:MAG: hypothetical protein EYC69_11475 [Bacteroidetes bacterium]|nr:MAG: hypothetical protein EYC69_11475 [Bacteroidota bacterium]
MRKLFLLFILLLSLDSVFAQSLSNLRSKYIQVSQDSISLDTLSLVPGSFYMVNADGKLIDDSSYSLDEVKGLLIWKEKPQTDSIKVNYRVFSFLLGETFQHKDASLLSKGEARNPFLYNPTKSQAELFKMPGLNRSGSISRGITFGNNQDVFVNSSLNLQLSGKLSENVEILAAITDENIPIQPEGNTQQLQDFDKVFIQLSDERNKLIAGDFELRRPDSYFMNFYKKAQGGYFTTSFDVSGKDTVQQKRELRSGVSFAVSKGKFAKNTILTVEGNQGPYRLKGSNGESFIIILAGTEKVYLDGRLLVRGAENDYVIDYNVAEIRFTAQRMITKDSRVVAEFEYSDKNYSRSLLYFNQEYESRKLKIKFNLYSEQDAKNQPLLIDLDSTRKAFLSDIGDDIGNAFFPTADSVAFNPDVVLYAQRDTILNTIQYSYYIYSTNSDSAKWQVTFTDVGFGNGDYILDLSSANGRVYKWVAPAAGIRQGNYTPFAIIVTPKKQQLFTLGADYQFNKKNKLSIETAASNNDINLFSTKDKKDDVGYASRLAYTNNLNLSEDTLRGWKLASVLTGEYAGKYFKPVERYRTVEFDRDWNLGTGTIQNDEYSGSFQTSLSKISLGIFSYQIKTYLKGENYKGLMNAASTSLTLNKFRVNADGSYLTTKGLTSRTNFLRHNAEISRPIWRLVLGLKESAEQNRFINLVSDSLFANSLGFQEWESYVSTADSAKRKATLSYKQRYDYVPYSGAFENSTRVDETTLRTDLSSNPKHTLRTTTTYRVLSISDTLYSNQEPSKNLLNRLDHSISLWKGIVVANTYYEVGSGQERKQEYFYLQVPAGQGVYGYLGDYNNNGVKDLDEFAVAAFADQAEYIRVFIPTNEFITTRSNQFSEILTLSPAGSTSSYQGTQPLLHRFSNQLLIRLDKKTKDESLLSSLNPFSRDIDDSLLVSANSSIRNTLYFNRTNPVYGADISIQQNRNKSILSNGFESRVLTSQGLNLRWNLNRSYLVTLSLEQSDKKSNSEFLTGRDYRILSESIEPKFSYQPGNVFRATASYKYLSKRNTLGLLDEKALSDKFSLELKYTTVNTGSMVAKINLINIKYNADDNSYLSYELLDGLKNGKNITWNLSIQRNISNSVQMSLNYDGRKLKDSKTIHTGGVQVRAFF